MVPMRCFSSKCLRRHDWSTLWLTQWNKTSRVHIRHSGCHSWLYDGRKKARTKPTQTRRTMMMEEDEEEEEEQKRTNWGRRGGRRAGRRPEEEKIARGGAWVQTNKKIGAKEQDRDIHKQTTKQANRTIQKTDLNKLQIGLHIMLISCAFSYPYSFERLIFAHFNVFVTDNRLSQIEVRTAFHLNLESMTHGRWRRPALLTTGGGKRCWPPGQRCWSCFRSSFGLETSPERRGRKGGVAYHRWWLAMLASGGDLAIFSKGLHKASNARAQAFLWSPAFELLAIQDVHWVSDGIFANVILKPPKP